MYDEKDLYRDAHVMITARVMDDPDSHPRDADCYSSDDIDAWRREEWSYVDLCVDVTVDGVRLGRDTLGGVESGTLPGTAETEPVTADPWDLTASRTVGDVTYMGGSPLWCVLAEALTQAENWLSVHGADGRILHHAKTWFTSLPAVDVPPAP